MPALVQPAHLLAASLLFGLQFLIWMKEGGLDESNRGRIIEFVRLRRESDLELKKRKLPDKKPPEEEPPTLLDEPAAEVEEGPAEAAPTVEGPAAAPVEEPAPRARRGRAPAVVTFVAPGGVAPATRGRGRGARPATARPAAARTSASMPSPKNSFGRPMRRPLSGCSRPRA